MVWVLAAAVAATLLTWWCCLLTLRRKSVPSAAGDWAGGRSDTRGER